VLEEVDAMQRLSMFALTGALALGLSCGPAEELRVDDLDTSVEGVTQYVQEGRYKAWTSDPAPRPGSEDSPHGSVRVYFNPKLEASLRAGSDVHPAGSMAVKEVYAADGVTVTTHLLNAKVADGTGKEQWLFFEGSAPDYRHPYYGRALAICTGCHEGGKDFALSPLP
jgi:hypothetical protein